MHIYVSNFKKPKKNIWKQQIIIHQNKKQKNTLEESPFLLWNKIPKSLKKKWRDQTQKIYKWGTCNVYANAPVLILYTIIYILFLKKI